MTTTVARTGLESRQAPMDLEATLESGLAGLAIDLDVSQRRTLLAFIELLSKWNQVYNLTSIKATHDMLVVHVLDSLSVLPLLDPSVAGPILDVGSGAGLPAIPLAIARPGWDVRSVDAVAKKVGFQLQARTALRLKNLTPNHGRVEELPPSLRPSVIVSRAYTEIPRMLASIEHLASGDTTVIAMKGAMPSDELRRVPPGWSVMAVDALRVPFLGAARCAVVLRRTV